MIENQVSIVCRGKLVYERPHHVNFVYGREGKRRELIIGEYNPVRTVSLVRGKDIGRE